MAMALNNELRTRGVAICAELMAIKHVNGKTYQGSLKSPKNRKSIGNVV